MKPSLILPALALLLGACQQQPGSTGGLPYEADPVLHAPAQLAGDSFALNMFRELAATRRGNIVFSPASLETTLRQLRRCTAGSTRGELNDLPLGKAGVGSATRLRSANMLFVDEDVKLRSQDSPEDGCGMVRRVPFLRDSAAAADSINEWCDGMTQGLITELVSRTDITPLTRLVALNAIYLREQWLRPFDEGATESEGRFRKADGTTTRTALMQQTAAFRHAEGSDWQAVALFYRRDGRKGEPACFIGILPKGDARAFARGMDVQKYNRIRRALAAAEPREISLTLPKMDVDGGIVPLMAALKKQGLKKCFSEHADFGGITDEPLYVADILQRARLIVTEEETEAAAATAAIAPWLLEDEAAPKPPAIRFDRPFVWAIGDLTTGAAPFFLGLYEGD